MTDHIATLEEILAEYEGSGFSEEKAALRAAIALMRGQSEVEVAVTATTPYGLGLIFVTDFNALPADTMLYARIAEKPACAG